MAIRNNTYIAPRKLDEQRYRHELKYVLDLERANKVMQELLLRCDHDPHGDKTNSYEIASTYYDTEDLRFYYDRQESVGYRRKIRLRSYNKEGKSSALFVEIKERHKNRISKKRVNLKDSSVLDAGYRHNEIPLDLVIKSMEDSADAREMAYLHKRLRLQPVAIVRYIRKALIPTVENTMRITLDTKITTGGTSLEKFDPDQEKFILDPRYGIFEVKTNHYIPIWLQSFLMEKNLYQSRFSKYCLSVDALFKGAKAWAPARVEDESEQRVDFPTRKAV